MLVYSDFISEPLNQGACVFLGCLMSENLQPVNISERVKRQINYCLNMQPENNKFSSLGDLRKKLDKLTPRQVDHKQTKLRSIRSTTTEKNLDNTIHELSTDLLRLNTNFECLLECFYTILDKIEELTSLKERLESMDLRLTHLECKISEPEVSVNNSRQDGSSSEQTTRIEKLEYLSSEHERENRLQQVIITHPRIDSDSNRLAEHVRDFLSTTMRMTGREIDANMRVSKRKRAHTVLVTFSSRLFKTFLFAARKKLRLDNDEQAAELFINENLTQYNFSFLKQLKGERKRRVEAGLPSFTSVFSFDGKVYAKVTSNAEKIHIKNKQAYMEFLSGLDSDNSETNSRIL